MGLNRIIRNVHRVKLFLVKYMSLIHEKKGVQVVKETEDLPGIKLIKEGDNSLCELGSKSHLTPEVLALCIKRGNAMPFSWEGEEDFGISVKLHRFSHYPFIASQVSKVQVVRWKLGDYFAKH
jgi:hypothetical protein